LFSVERFRQVLATWHHKKAKDICERMISRVKKFTSRDQLDDDATLMIVKVPGGD
jgi:serine phosphatase RsbU (regulator of sigma subunit)